MGDFEVVRVGGKLQKNGGNVVTYFCTPDMRVLHFVVGPVSAGSLMDEAAWAHRVFDATRMKDRTGATKAKLVKTSREQIEAVRKEHKAMIAGDADAAMRQMAVQREAFAKMRRGTSAYRYASYGGSATKAKIERWEPLLWSLGGSNEKRVHRLLAFDPLPPLAAVDATVFRQLAGQPLNDRNGSVAKAIDEVQRAERLGRPVMFVFHRHWQSWRTSYQRAALGQAANHKWIGQFAVVNLPLKEQPALSAELPAFELPAAGDGVAGVQIVLADCSGARIAAVSDCTSPDEFRLALQRTVAENHLTYARRLVEQDRRREAKRLLYRVRRSDDCGVAARAEDLLGQLLAVNE
jgi:hypothetical protein